MILKEPGEGWVWARELGIEKQKVIRELHRVQPGRNSLVLLFLGLWVFGILLIRSFPLLLAHLFAYVIIGVAIHGLAILMHEGCHGNLFRNRWKDRWLGVFCGAPALLSCSAYRVVHLKHHRHVRTAEDPEEFMNLSRRPWVRSLAFYGWIVIGALPYLVLVPVNAIVLGRWRDRVDIVSEYALLIALHGTVLAVAWRYELLPLLLHGWVIPLLVVSIFTNVRGWAEHAMTMPGHPLTQSRVITSNRLVSLLMCNLNYHLEHHLYPAMPWYNLRKLHELLSDEYRKAGAFVYSSYFRFLRDAFRTGLHGQAPRFRLGDGVGVSPDSSSR